MLLDEPARGLDAPLRAELYSLLRKIREEFAIPILLVTHDLEECFELAEEMLILREGRIVQSGAPREIVEQPASVEVARLLGASNLFEAEILALDPGRNTSRLKFQNHVITGTYFAGHLLGDRVWLCVRAEELRAMRQNGSRPEPNQVPAELVRIAEQAPIGAPGVLRRHFRGHAASGIRAPKG